MVEGAGGRQRATEARARVAGKRRVWGGWSWVDAWALAWTGERQCSRIDPQIDTVWIQDWRRAGCGYSFFAESPREFELDDPLDDPLDEVSALAAFVAASPFVPAFDESDALDLPPFEAPPSGFDADSVLLSDFSSPFADFEVAGFDSPSPDLRT